MPDGDDGADHGDSIVTGTDHADAVDAQITSVTESMTTHRCDPVMMSCVILIRFPLYSSKADLNHCPLVAHRVSGTINCDECDRRRS